MSSLGDLKASARGIIEGVRRRLFLVWPSGLRYRLGSLAFSREHRAVSYGIAAHYRRSRLGEEQFALRRRIHMLEKGLSMRPRRTTFAVSYLTETLDRLEACISADVMNEETKAWARDVLTAYFEATAESESKVIFEQRKRFANLALQSSLIEFSGPSPAGELNPGVDVESLTQLAFDRRSVRWFDGRPVPRTAVDRALRIAQEAPTACNRVPYRFVIIDDPSQAVEVAKIAGGTAGYAEVIPALAVIVGDLSAYSEERDRHLIYIDGGLAAMGFLFGLQVQGIASCCINWPDVKKRENKMAETLGLRPFERVVMLVAFGYADPTGLVPGSPKLPLSDLRIFK